MGQRGEKACRFVGPARLLEFKSDRATNRGVTTERECLEALREAADRLGTSPTKAEYEELGLTPASATIIRTIGGWNEAKELAGLETYPSRGPRVSPPPDDIELPNGTSWDELSVDQRWHYRNAEWNTERSLRRRARHRRWLNDYKRKRGCNSCDVDDVACLDFHHVSTRTKRMSVGRMVTYGYGKDAIRDEIEKCVVLCANCHRVAHHEPPERELKQWAWERKRMAGGCVRCGEHRPACLDFHHPTDEKEATVATLISDNRSKTRIQAEIDRCTVLCANCHRKKHYEPPYRD